MSVRWSISPGTASACSGDMYRGVPMMSPLPLRSWLSCSDLARPKSASFG